MPSLKALWLYMAMILLAAGWVGCVPGGGSAQEEEGDPDYRVGMNRKQAGNYVRAIESFERALHRNPQSAAAHFELGLIYYQKATNYVAAIYHFDRVQRLRPNFSKIDVVRDLIRVCKQELVRDAMAGFNVQMQREMERLERALQQNAALRQEVAQLQAQLNQRYPQATGASPAPATPLPGSEVPDARTAVAAVQNGPGTGTVSIYRVRQGETLYSIARRHGLTEAALRMANPGIVPTRMSPGQEIRIPSRDGAR